MRAGMETGKQRKALTGGPVTRGLARTAEVGSEKRQPSSGTWRWSRYGGLGEGSQGNLLPLAW